jgi:hypothetical protein
MTDGDSWLDWDGVVVPGIRTCPHALLHRRDQPRGAAPMTSRDWLVLRGAPSPAKERGG